MARFSFWSLPLAISLAGVACANDDDMQAHLIHLEAVEQRWEHAEQLFVRGDGLPAAMRGEARLVGLIFPPGEPARAIDIKLPCRALGGNEAVVALNQRSTSGNAEGPFEGRLELRFGAPKETGLAGRLDHVLVRLESPQTREEQFERTQRARRFQRDVGINALLLSEHGTTVAELSPDGAAARAGLKPGDELARLDGRPLQLPRDLLPSAGADSIALEVRRDSERTSTRVVRIPIVPDAPPLLWSLLTLTFVLGASFGALLGGSVPENLLSAPRRHELLLAICSLLSLLVVLGLVVDVLAPIARDACRAFGLGTLSAALFVCCLRRLRPTSRTTRDPALAPLL